MSDCFEESASQHFRGKRFGFGPVRGSELVLFAVFESTPYGPDGLETDAFDARKMRKADQSLARTSYVTRREFTSRIAQPQEAKLGRLVGVAVASVEALRKLDFVVPGLYPRVSGRAVCVLDKVQFEDHDSHAALGYSAGIAPLTAKQKQTVRELIHGELTVLFDTVRPVEAVNWHAPVWIRLVRAGRWCLGRLGYSWPVRLARRTED